MRDHTTLLVWRLARDQSRELYHFSTVRWTPPLGFIFDQLRRASLSVRLNLVEGYAWRPTPKWRQHLRIALGSAMETSECVRFLVEVGAMSDRDGVHFLEKSRRVERLLYGLIRERKPHP
jgi:four helix bundle protein